MEKNNTLIRPAAILGVALGASIVLSTLIGAYSFYKVRLADNAISVTGSASADVVSDSAKWVASISRQVKESELKDGQALLASDLAAVRDFYTAHHVDPQTLVISPVMMDQVYDYSNKGDTAQERQYNLRQTIELSSNDVAALTGIAHDSSSLASQGIIFQTQSLEYFYSKLPDLRVSLLADAIRDAKARAEKILEPSGQKVGVLKSASSGVVQVLSPNSIEVSDYGSYDTSSVNKRVMITVRAAFTIR